MPHFAICAFLPTWKRRSDARTHTYTHATDFLQHSPELIFNETKHVNGQILSHENCSASSEWKSLPAMKRLQRKSQWLDEQKTTAENRSFAAYEIDCNRNAHFLVHIRFDCARPTIFIHAIIDSRRCDDKVLATFKCTLACMNCEWTKTSKAKKNAWKTNDTDEANDEEDKWNSYIMSKDVKRMLYIFI